MKRHIIPNYLLNPSHPVTVNLIGCGGTGSQVLTCLGRINHSLKQLGHPGFHVITYDADMVSRSNIGRQLFPADDMGLNKALVLTSRINRFFGTAWEAVPEFFTRESAVSSNITICCVDVLESRLEIEKIMKKFAKTHRNNEPYLCPYYLLDFGNTVDSGQVVLGTLTELEQPASKKFETVSRLPLFSERFDISKINEKDSGPSCSLAEALKKQNLFINSSLAQLGCDLLWRMFSEGMLDRSGLFLNLRWMNMNPVYL